MFNSCLMFDVCSSLNLSLDYYQAFLWLAIIFKTAAHKIFARLVVLNPESVLIVFGRRGEGNTRFVRNPFDSGTQILFVVFLKTYS